VVFKRKTRIEKIIQRGIKLVSLGVTDKLKKVIEEGEKLASYNVGIPRVDIYEYGGRGYYIINEPQLSPREVEAYYRIMDELYFSLRPVVEVEPSKVIDEVFKIISKIYKGVDVNKIKYYVIRDTLGYGPLDTIMNDPRIEDISCEGVNRPIRVFHRDFSYLDWLITNIVFENEEEADRIALLLAHKARKHVSTAFPIAEGTLPEKHRIVITYGFEVTPFGSGFTVRKFREEPLSIAHLIKLGTISSLMAAYWWILLENKGSAFIVGEMASGKSVHPRSVILAIINGIPTTLTIEELWNKIQEKSKVVKVGELEYIDLENMDIKILTLNKFNIEWRKPRYIIRHKAPKKLVRIRLSSGREIIVTQDHSLLVLEPDGNIKPIKPHELSKEHYMLSISRIEMPSINKTYVKKKIIEILNMSLLNNHLQLHKELLNSNNSNNEKLNKGSNVTPQLATISSIDFAYSLGLALVHRDSKFNLDKDVKRQLLSLAYLMDKKWALQLVKGIIDGSKASGRNEIIVQDQEIAYSILYLLSYLNIRYSIENKSNEFHIIIHSSVEGSLENNPSNTNRLETHSISLEKVDKIEVIDSDVDYVYDIEVPETENFEVNTVFVHNTTLMNALLTLLPPNAKIVTIEDTPELRLPHIGWKPLVARHTYTLTGGKATEISLFDLVKLALRERATCIAIGEIRGEEAYVFIQAIASGHGGLCLKYNEPLIIKFNGYVKIIPIGKLVEKIISKEMNGKVEALSYNPKRGLEWKPIRKVIKINGLRTWIKIQTAGGKVIEVTEDHLIPVLSKNSSIVHKRAKDVKKGDRILIASKIPAETRHLAISLGNPSLRVEMNEVLGLLIGTYISQRLSNNNNSKELLISLNKRNRDLANYLINTLKEAFNIEPKVNIHGDRVEIRITSNMKVLTLLAAKLGLESNKQDDFDCLLNTPREFRIGVIRGCWTNNLDMGKDEYKLTVKSRTLAYKLHYLMKSLGIDSYIEEIRINNKLYYSIKVKNSIDKQRLKNIILKSGLKHEKEPLQLKQLPDVRFDIVTDIKRLLINEVAYDVEVEENHTLIHGCSVITHNCTFHGDSLESMVMRLTTPPINVPLSFLPLITNVILTRYIRIPGKRPMRRVTRVYEITGLKSPTELEYKVIFEWSILEDKHYPDTPEEVVEKSVKLKRVATLLGWSKEVLLQELERRRRLLDKLVREGKLSYNEVALAIQNYYKEVWKPSE